MILLLLLLLLAGPAPKKKCLPKTLKTRTARMKSDVSFSLLNPMSPQNMTVRISQTHNNNNRQ